MCGIAALFSLNGTNVAPYIEPMTRLVRHRGPDDAGYAVSASFKAGDIAFYGDVDTPEACYAGQMPYRPQTAAAGLASLEGAVALGHRRLTIIDLSAAGHQPMCSEDRRYTIVYNGEVYNFAELRAELEAEGCRFYSNTDTEVVINAYRTWGEECLHRFNGMFAFVLYDRQAGRLFAARDRFGIKPLYYWFSPKGFLAFASEIKQFSALPDWKATLNRARGYDFLKWRFADHTAETLFEGVFQIRGGHRVCCDLEGLGDRLPIQRWYSLEPRPCTEDFAAATDTFRELLTDAVRLRLRADVPVGTSFSGGLDSSAIVCIINDLLKQQGAAERQKTFSSCSEIERFDERRFIEKIVESTQVQAHYAFPPLDELFETADRMVWHHDEPFLSTSIYAEWHVFRLVAENGVKVTLDGHGADEQLAGYHSFISVRYAGLLCRLRWLELAKEMGACRDVHGYSTAWSVKHMMMMVLPHAVQEALRKAGNKETADPDWLNVGRLGQRTYNPHAELGLMTPSRRTHSRGLITDTSMPVQLHWADRDSMAHSIESRVPYMDHRLMEFTLGLPEEYLLHRGLTKRVLRESMRGILPEAIRGRIDKMGFVTPEEVWVREHDPAGFRRELEKAVEQSAGVINPNALAKLDRIVAGEEAFSFFAWRLICFGKWMDRFSVAL